MPRITYVHPDGRRETVTARDGTSVMMAALGAGIDGIRAECNGHALCATCHVYVDPDQLALLPPMSDTEDALLDGTAAERRETSRLACQIALGHALDGLVVHLPDRQI